MPLGLIIYDWYHSDITMLSVSRLGRGSFEKIENKPDVCKTLNVFMDYDFCVYGIQSSHIHVVL